MQEKRLECLMML